MVGTYFRKRHYLNEMLNGHPAETRRLRPAGSISRPEFSQQGQLLHYAGWDGRSEAPRSLMAGTAKPTIYFVNGHFQDNWIGRNIVGSSSAGEAYWASGFANAAKNYFGDYNPVTDANFISGSSAVGFDSSGGGRYQRGFDFMNTNLEAYTQNLSSGDTIKMVTHSEGSAYGAGIARRLLDAGFRVTKILHLSSDEGDEFTTPAEPFTIQLSYDGDWVTGNKNITGVDLSGVANMNLGWQYSHGSTKGPDAFKRAVDLESVRIQQYMGPTGGGTGVRTWYQQVPGTTPNGTDFIRVNGHIIFGENGVRKE